MVTKVYTPSEAAATIGVSASTVRDWAQRFPTHLSEDANPPKGVARVFTDRDVGILQRVAELRAQHKSYLEIETELATMPPDEEIAPYIDGAATQTPTTALEAPQAPDVTLHTAMLVKTSLEAFGERMSRVEAMQEEAKKENASKLAAYIYGILTGMLLLGLAILAVWLGGGFGR